MALDWNISKVKLKDELFHEDNELKGVYEQLIWCTMLVGIPKITEENYKQFFNRVELYQRFEKSLLTFCDDDNELSTYFITLDDVKKMIGMYTNASRITATQYFKKFKHFF